MVLTVRHNDVSYLDYHASPRKCRVDPERLGPDDGNTWRAKIVRKLPIGRLFWWDSISTWRSPFGTVWSKRFSCIVCLGFVFNRVNGTRGALDEHITAPSDVIGQMSARFSQEGIELLRERMIAQMSLVVVGSTDVKWTNLPPTAC